MLKQKGQLQQDKANHSPFPYCGNQNITSDCPHSLSKTTKALGLYLLWGGTELLAKSQIRSWVSFLAMSFTGNTNKNSAWLRKWLKVKWLSGLSKERIQCSSRIPRHIEPSYKVRYISFCNLSATAQACLPHLQGAGCIATGCSPFPVLIFPCLSVFSLTPPWCPLTS